MGHGGVKGEMGGMENVVEVDDGYVDERGCESGWVR